MFVLIIFQVVPKVSSTIPVAIFIRLLPKDNKRIRLPFNNNTTCTLHTEN